MNKYPTTYIYPVCVYSCENETEALAQFIRDCYNLNSVCYNTPERNFLRSMVCDTDNMGLGMRLDTFNYADGCKSRDDLLNVVAITMQDNFAVEQSESQKWIQEYNDYDLDDLDDDEWDCLNSWYDHHKFISMVNPQNINWVKLAENVWGVDMDMWLDGKED